MDYSYGIGEHVTSKKECSTVALLEPNGTSKLSSKRGNLKNSAFSKQNIQVSVISTGGVDRFLFQFV